MSPIWPDNDGWLSHHGEWSAFDSDDRAEDRRDWVADEVADAEDFLADLIAEEMIADPDIRAGRMLVTVQNGVAILQGQVDTDGTRSAAARRAWATPGVFDVCNMLAVARDDRA